MFVYTQDTEAPDPALPTWLHGGGGGGRGSSPLARALCSQTDDQLHGQVSHASGVAAERGGGKTLQVPDLWPETVAIVVFSDAKRVCWDTF